MTQTQWPDSTPIIQRILRYVLENDGEKSVYNVDRHFVIHETVPDSHQASNVVMLLTRRGHLEFVGDSGKLSITEDGRAALRGAAQ